jgi:hypothetical protein
VFRARHLDGRTVLAGQPFHFDVHIFDLQNPAIAYFVLTFAEIAREGLGPRRGIAELGSVWQLDVSGNPATRIYDGATFLLKNSPQPIRLSLQPAREEVRRIRVKFLSPTELKTSQQLAKQPEFSILFHRIRDRVGTLRALYGFGPLEIDFKAMGVRSLAVQMTRCDIRIVDVERRSARTGQAHPLSGFIGYAEYHGDNLAEFLPYLEAAQWTGVGRQTVWGKGEVLVQELNGPDFERVLN